MRTTNRCLASQFCVSMLLPLALLVAGCDSDHSVETTPPPPSSSPLLAGDAPDGVAVISYGLPLEHIETGDLDGNALKDLTLSSHVANRVDVIFQEAERSFASTAGLQEVGFHPNNTLFVSGQDRRGYLLLSAETRNQLQVYRFKDAGSPVLVGGIETPAPTLSAAARQRDGSLAIAVAQKGGGALRIIPSLDLDRPRNSATLNMELTPRMARRVTALQVADLGPDAAQAFVVALPQEGRVVSVAPTDDGGFLVDDLWSSNQRTAADTVLPFDFNSDHTDDFFLVGQTMPRVVLLLSDGSGGFRERSFDLEFLGAQSGAVLRDADGSVLLFVARSHQLMIFRWPSDRLNAKRPEVTVLQRAGRDWMRFAVDDMDGDGYQDLVLGSSVGFVPPTVVFGPIYEKIPRLALWLRGPDASSTETN